MREDLMVKVQSLEEVKQKYETWHAHWAPVSAPAADLEAPWYRWVRETLPSLTGLTVLEVACGRGALVDWLASQGARVTGCDISQVALAQARATFGRDYLVGDIQGMCFPTSSFDVVICCETLEHTLDPDQSLRELVRVAKPGATVLLTTPNYLNTYGLYRAYLRLRGRPFGAHGIQPIDRAFFSFGVLRRFRRAGLRVRRTYGLVHFLRPARDRLLFIEESSFLRNALKHFGLHFAIVAEVGKKKQ